MNLEPIGIIHSSFKEMSGTPIQPAFADGAEGAVEVFSQTGHRTESDDRVAIHAETSDARGQLPPGGRL
jgi:hypothetical protein